MIVKVMDDWIYLSMICYFMNFNFLLNENRIYLVDK